MGRKLEPVGSKGTPEALSTVIRMTIEVNTAAVKKLVLMIERKF